ncbi:hypothetical protein D9757_004319 [Collybiopsis confluens]|uniref:Adhesin domain-containing protein n=1 Tax=Collybiopsis confluens TaxID=2823264 RepID=A0A8H5HTR6_9AGAR|nr:hypothetical protein D9757_004319 [Collybiopsis confluens]
MAPIVRVNGRTFSEMVGATMAMFNPKDHSGSYKQVTTDKVERHSASSAGYRDRERGLQAIEEEEGLLNPDMQRSLRPKRSGTTCGLLWRIGGIVAALILIFSAGKLIVWALTPAPGGLEGMPVFSESLGCSDASFLYNGGETSVSVPVGDRNDHAVDIFGGSIGTVTVTEAPADITEVQYKVTIRSNDQSLLDQIVLQYPVTGETVIFSRLLVRTPRLERDSASCLRHDVTMYVPKNVKKLHILGHATSQIQFDPHARFDLDDAYVTLFSLDKRNMIMPSENLRATKVALELTRGWIAGHVSAVSSMSLTSQRGDGVVNVHVHPTAPVDPLNPDPISLHTTTGAGRTDIFLINDKAFPHRPIKSIHSSSRNADVHLTYKEAQFNGNIALDSGTFDVTGANAYEENNGPYTHWVGEKSGKDEIRVTSRGWTGLHF